MSVQESRGYCDHCERWVLARRPGPNHILHFVLTWVTCGLWFFVWLCVMLFPSGAWLCPTCGAGTRS